MQRSIDWVENEEMDVEKALLQLLAFLNNRSEDFLKSVEEATILTHGRFCRLQNPPGQYILASLVLLLTKPRVRQYKSLNSFLELNPSFEEVLELIEEFVDESAYSARIFEISIHALFQVFEDAKCLEGYLKPISQMRSANKKHGNISPSSVTFHTDSRPIAPYLEAYSLKSFIAKRHRYEPGRKTIAGPQPGPGTGPRHRSGSHCRRPVHGHG
ncbi:MAG: hypothetical protein J5I98_26780 [Phaeodactylibacter sp.]|nr:hypothetical protein [Phaeodactylibacter sp.]